MGFIVPDKFKAYAGEDIEDIPSYYLHWVATNVEESTPELQAFVEACDKEHQWRTANNAHISKSEYEWRKSR